MKHKTTNTNPENPCVGVGAIVVHEGRILLVKRAAEPGRGLWAIPGGRLKLGETLKECARREILEETGVPSLVLEADMCDTRAFAESQLTTRIQAFMESLE